MIRSLRSTPLLGLLTMTAACGGISLGTGSSASGCGPGGANANQHGVGDQPGGVALQAGDIAVAPSGDFVIFQGTTRLAVGFPKTGKVEELALESPTTLAFSRKRDVVYVGSSADGRVHAIDVTTKEELWATPAVEADQSYLRIASSGDDSRVIAYGLGTLTLLDAVTGTKVAEATKERFIVDVAILPDSGRALVVTGESWSTDTVLVPTTTVSVIALADGVSHDFTVPNCASTLAVTPDGTRAFLSPTTCMKKDPVSVLDLKEGAEGWLKNLPGFGPLAMGPDGATAVAFLDVQKLDETLFDDPAQIPPHAPGDTRYHIMTLDTKSLAFDFTKVGDSLPRYAITPDGSVLLVDSSESAAEPLRLFDTKTRSFRSVSGPAVKLDNFVISSDAAHVFALAPELVDVDVKAATATMILVPFIPTNINISPDDQTLFLRTSPTAICVFSLAERGCKATFSGNLLASK